MPTINLHTANILFNEQKYSEALDQFCTLVDRKENPAFCSFMAGKCLVFLNKISGAYSYYQKAVTYDDSNAFINREIERFLIEHHLVNSQKKIIWHYFPNTTNIGDSGAAAGIRTLFRSLTDDFFFFTLSCQKDTIDVLKKLQTKASGIIIGGGGLFFHQPLASNWYFPLSSTEIAELELPAITYAIGFNQEYSDNKVWNLDEAFLTHIAEFHHRFVLKSVRDNWSKDILEKRDVSDIHLVPCPSAFLEPLPWFKVAIDASKKIVGLSITDRSLKKDRKLKIFPIFFKFAQWLSQHDFYPLFILQDTSDDIPLAKLIAENHFSCILPNTVREAISIYNQCCFVVGMRGHSLMLAAGQCVPLCAISYNKKVDAFMEILELQKYCLNQEDISEQNVLIQNFEKLLVEKDRVVAALKNKRELFYRLNSEYCKNAIALLSKT